MEFEATYSFNVRRFLRVKIEALTPEEAVELAKQQAKDKVEAELLIIENCDIGYGKTDILDPHLIVEGPKDLNFEEFFNDEIAIPELER